MWLINYNILFCLFSFLIMIYSIKNQDNVLIITASLNQSYDLIISSPSSNCASQVSRHLLDLYYADYVPDSNIISFMLCTVYGHSWNRIFSLPTNIIAASSCSQFSLWPWKYNNGEKTNFRNCKWALQKRM